MRGSSKEKDKYKPLGGKSTCRYLHYLKRPRPFFEAFELSTRFSKVPVPYGVTKLLVQSPQMNLFDASLVELTTQGCAIVVFASWHQGNLVVPLTANKRAP